MPCGSRRIQISDSSRWLRPSRHHWPDVVPRAIDYYRELERSSTLAYEASPYRKGAKPVKFNFDWTFDFYPLAYERPGPVMQIYRLRGAKCG